jgi:hypothetical protein
LARVCASGTCDCAATAWPAIRRRCAKPRHFLVYRVEPGLRVVGGVLHDAMELSRPLEEDASWQ